MGSESLPVVFLMGPTASGKTEIASRLFQDLDCELISVDAVQVYRGMDIGTAKPNSDFLCRYPHHLIDIRHVSDNYSVAEFAQDASEIIEGILDRGKIPVLVGGTMFYFSVLENGISSLPASDPDLRKHLDQEIQQHGLEKLYRELELVDQVSAEKLSSTDTQRVQRAVELYRQTGVPPSQLMKQSRQFKLTGKILKLAMFRADRASLHQQIDIRFHEMIEAGLVDEVRALVKSIGQPECQPAMRSVGYRQVLEFLEGKITHGQMLQAGIAATRQLAKRQLTWLRNQSNLVWFETSQKKMMESLLAYLRSQKITVTK